MSARSRRTRQQRTVSLFGLVVAIGLSTYALSLSSPRELASAAWVSVASAGATVSVGVAPNPDNTLNAQLEQKAAQLAVREQHLQELQQTIGSDRLGLYSLIASVLVLLLVALNFYFDWKRSRGEGGVLTRPLALDLRRAR